MAESVAAFAASIASVAASVAASAAAVAAAPAAVAAATAAVPAAVAAAVAATPAAVAAAIAASTAISLADLPTVAVIESVLPADALSAPAVADSVKSPDVFGALSAYVTTPYPACVTVTELPIAAVEPDVTMPAPGIVSATLKALELLRVVDNTSCVPGATRFPAASLMVRVRSIASPGV